VIETPSIDWAALSPELVLLTAAALAMLFAVLIPKWLEKPLAAIVCALGFVGAFIASGVLFDHSADGHAVIADAIQRDRLAALTQMIIAGAGLLSVAVAYAGRGAWKHSGEFFALLASAGAGMMFLVAANNLLTLFLGLEWFSISLYILAAFEVDVVSSLEAGLKYLIVGSFGSAVLLFGSALVYGTTGHLDFPGIASAGHTSDPLFIAGLAMIIAGLGFKASAAPFHMWTPDVYEGSPTGVTAFMSAATKAAALVLMLRVLTTAFPARAEVWTIAVAVLAVASLAVGNLAALVQRRVKRMLAYSSISQAGFMLIAIAAGNALGGRALLYYLIVYGAMSIGAFAVVAARERELGEPVTLDNLAGFGWERPFLGVAMWTFMLGFAGLPLTGGFVAKFYAFSAAYERGWIWLVVVGVIATAISLYYYLAVIRAMYMRPAEELQLAPSGGSPPPERLVQGAVAGALIVTVGSFFAVQPLIDLAKDAATSLTFPF
jgi:NADH-quinone oxidoreductase subunit N